jgi:hypothetical protein
VDETNAEGLSANLTLILTGCSGWKVRLRCTAVLAKDRIHIAGNNEASPARMDGRGSSVIRP